MLVRPNGANLQKNELASAPFATGFANAMAAAALELGPNLDELAIADRTDHHAAGFWASVARLRTTNGVPQGRR